jgi:hypothetical protein
MLRKINRKTGHMVGDPTITIEHHISSLPVKVITLEASSIHGIPSEPAYARIA